MSSEALRQQLKATEDPQQRVPLVKALATALLHENNPAEALSSLEEALKTVPADLELMLAMRDALVRLGRPRDALAWLQQTLAFMATDTERARLLLVMGELYQNELQEPDLALRAFADARGLDPSVFERVPPPGASPDGLPSLDELPPLPPPPPVLAPRPSRPPALAQQPAAPARPKPQLVLAGAAVLVVVVALWFGVFARHSSAANGQVTCAKELIERRMGDYVEYECMGDDVTRRWKVRGDLVFEFAELRGGQLEGAYRTIPSPGLRIEGSYLQGQQSGVWRTWEADVLVGDEEWAEGVKDGAARAYFPDGGVRELQHWRAGKRHGAFVKFSASGLPEREGQWDSDKMSGAWARYDQSGKVVERWTEPRDAGVAPKAAAKEAPDAVELFAGRPLAWWSTRYAELKQHAAGEPAAEARLTLLLQRAALHGLRFDEPTARFEVAP